MLGQVGDSLEPYVRQRAHREGDPLVHQALDKGQVADDTYTVVDPLDAKGVEHVADVARVALLARVRDRVEAVGPGAVEDGLEPDRRVADLGRAQADAEHRYAAGPRLLVRLHRGLRRQVAQQRDDQPRADAVTVVRTGQRVVHALERGRRRDASAGVRLEVEEHLGPANAGASRPSEVGIGEVGEVLAVLQHGHVRVVQVEELLKVAELVARAELSDVRVRQRESVAPCQREDELGLEGPLQMYVQLRPRGHSSPAPSCVEC